MRLSLGAKITLHWLLLSHMSVLSGARLDNPSFKNSKAILSNNSAAKLPTT